MSDQSTSQPEAPAAAGESSQPNFSSSSMQMGIVASLLISLLAAVAAWGIVQPMDPVFEVEGEPIDEADSGGGGGGGIDDPQPVGGGGKKKSNRPKRPDGASLDANSRSQYANIRSDDEFRQTFFTSTEIATALQDESKAKPTDDPTDASDAPSGDQDPSAKPSKPGKAGQGGGRKGRGRLDPATIMERNDKDGDGKLVGDEIPAQMSQRLDTIDTDSNGEVSLEEVQAMVSRFAGGGQGTQSPGGPTGTQSPGGPTGTQSPGGPSPGGAPSSAGAPPADEGADTAAERLVNLRNGMVVLGIWGAVLAGFLATAEALSRSAGVMTVAHGLLGVVVGGMAGVGGSCIGMMIADAIASDVWESAMAKTIVIQCGMLMPVGLAVGLSVSLLHGKLKMIANVTIGGIVGAGLAATLYPFCVGLLIPTIQTEKFLPNDGARLLWLVMASFFIGITAAGLGREKK